MSIVTFAFGVFVGGALGILIMALFANSRER
jgi:hypothetical protein